MRYWLIKSEGTCYSLLDLKKDRRTPWTGIRNYQARNFMRDDMRPGDLALFYYSNGSTENPAGAYGVAKVAGKPHPDETQFNPKDEHFDPKSKPENPTWVCVDMAFVKIFKRPVTLSEIKRDPKLAGMAVRERGSRLSIQPVSENHFKYIADILSNRDKSTQN